MSVNHMHAVPMEPEEGIGFPRLELQMELQTSYKSGPLLEQQVLLTTEPFFQAQSHRTLMVLEAIQSSFSGLCLSVAERNAGGNQSLYLSPQK